MRRLLVLLTLIFSFLITQGQTKIFKTYEDFSNGIGETMDDDYVKWTRSPVGMTIKFQNITGDVVKYHPGDLWGFTYKGHFFRMVGKEMAMLTDTSKVNYFLNGSAGLGILSRDDGKGGHIREGETECFLTVGDPFGKIYRMPLSKMAYKDYKDLQRDHPQLETLYDCFSFKINISIYKNVKECVTRFNRK